MLSRKAAGDLAYFSDHDRQIRTAMNERLAKDAEYLDEIVTDFAIYARRMDVTRFLVRLDLFKLALEVPGAFVEIGVYKGEGLLTWAKLLDIYCPGDTSRRVVGFDNFEGFKSLHAHDGAALQQGNKEIGGWNPAHAKEDLDFFIELFQKDRFLPRSRMIDLVEGDVCATAKAYVETNPGLRIALLNLDVDLYEPTLAALETLYPLMPAGGVVLVDEYGAKAWPGPAKALEHYFGTRQPRLRKHSLFTLPGAYFIKE